MYLSSFTCGRLGKSGMMSLLVPGVGLSGCRLDVLLKKLAVFLFLGLLFIWVVFPPPPPFFPFPFFHFSGHSLFLEYVRRKYPLRNCGL